MGSYILTALRLVTGGILLYWAYHNLYPVEWMEYNLVEEHLAGWNSAPIFARLLIALKFGCGVFLILNINPKNLVSKILFVILLIHVYDLVWSITTEYKVMETSYSYIAVNNLFSSAAVLILVLVITVFLIFRSEASDIKIKWLKYAFLLIVFALPFILNPVYPSDFKDVSQHVDEPFDTASVASPGLKKLSEEGILIAYFSTNCQFCLNAARKIRIAQMQHPAFPKVYVCMLGDSTGASRFFDKANSSFDYEVLTEDKFSTLSKLSFPRFAWVEKGRVLRRWDGHTFNFGAITELCSGNPGK